MFDAITPGQHAKLGPLLRTYIDQQQVGGEVYQGPWHNVGTVQQLEQLNAPRAALAPGRAPAARDVQ